MICSVYTADKGETNTSGAHFPGVQALQKTLWFLDLQTKGGSSGMAE